VRISRLIAVHVGMINAYIWTDFLQIMTQSVHLGQEEVDIGLRHRGTGDDISEEVGPPIVRLIANHQRAGLHHAAFQNRADLEAHMILI